MKIIVNTSKLAPRPQVETVAKLFPIMNEPEPETQFSRVNIEPEDVEQVEAKVVKARRGRRPVVTSEVAETA